MEPSGMNGTEGGGKGGTSKIVESAKRAENSYRTDESLTAAIAADTHRRVTGWRQAAIGRRISPLILLRSRRPFGSKLDKPKELRS